MKIGETKSSTARVDNLSRENRSRSENTALRQLSQYLLITPLVHFKAIGITNTIAMLQTAWQNKDPFLFYKAYCMLLIVCLEGESFDDDNVNNERDCALSVSGNIEYSIRSIRGFMNGQDTSCMLTFHSGTSGTRWYIEYHNGGNGLDVGLKYFSDGAFQSIAIQRIFERKLANWCYSAEEKLNDSFLPKHSVFLRLEPPK